VLHLNNVARRPARSAVLVRVALEMGPVVLATPFVAKAAKSDMVNVKVLFYYPILVF
jgi:hypothetical protein